MMDRPSHGVSSSISYDFDFASLVKSLPDGDLMCEFRPQQYIFTPPDRRDEVLGVTEYLFCLIL